MSVPILSLRDVAVNIGQKNIFSDVNFQIYPGDKICLVGKNGSGKSTLMKVILNEMEVDEGEVFHQPGTKITALSQKLELFEKGTIYQYLLDEFDDKENHQYLCDLILDKLELDGNQDLKALSGGQVRRVNLAKALILEPDLLLLDEPTNHLDIATIEWLESYIKSYNGACLIVSHDREFLKNVSNKIIWIDRTKVNVNQNIGFIGYEEWSDNIINDEINQLHKLRKDLEKEEWWLHQGISARRKRNQKRLGDLLALRETIKQKASKVSAVRKKLQYDTDDEKDKKSEFVLEFINTSFGYKEEKLILDHLNLRVLKKEKIGVVGPNGSGKTTMLQLITGDLTPLTGKVKLGSNINISYFDQYKTVMNENQSVKKFLCPDGSDFITVNGKNRHVAAYLKDFLFNPKILYDSISDLSGGEQNRLYLAKILANPTELMILDEPTNDLDIDTLDFLLEVLTEYKGTLIIVSHDRDFINKLVTRTICFDGKGKIYDLVGGDYNDYKALIEEARRQEIIAIKTPERVVEKKEEKIVFSYKHKRELELSTIRIDELTREIKELEELFASNNPDQSKFTEYQDKKTELEALEIRWLELEEMREKSI